jgi:hypothetical protein
MRVCARTFAPLQKESQRIRRFELSVRGALVLHADTRTVTAIFQFRTSYQKSLEVVAALIDELRLEAPEEFLVGQLWDEHAREHWGVCVCV